MLGVTYAECRKKPFMLNIVMLNVVEKDRRSILVPLKMKLYKKIKKTKKPSLKIMLGETNTLAYYTQKVLYKLTYRNPML
jgi:hypothetical protein